MVPKERDWMMRESEGGGNTSFGVQQEKNLELELKLKLGPPGLEEPSTLSLGYVPKASKTTKRGFFETVQSKIEGCPPHAATVNVAGGNRNNSQPSLNINQPTIVSRSWDYPIKVWNLTNCKIKNTLTGNGGYVNTVAVSPDGSLCASGGRDGVTLLWDLAEGKRLYSLDAGTIIHVLCFSPNRYWLCAAIEESVKIWDLESKSVVQDLKPTEPAAPGKHQTLTSYIVLPNLTHWTKARSSIKA